MSSYRRSEFAPNTQVVRADTMREMQDNRIKELEAEIAELRKEKERLDRLNRQLHPYARIHFGMNNVETLRELADRLIAADQKDTE